MFRDVFESRWGGLSQVKIEIKTVPGRIKNVTGKAQKQRTNEIQSKKDV